MNRLHPDKSLRAFLLDITGVLVESSAEGDGVTIEGSVEAVRRLEAEGIPFRLVTNETQKTRDGLVQKLNRLGFSISPDKVFNPAMAMASIITARKLRPFLLVHPNCLPDFPEEIVQLNKSSDDVGIFDSVILGDATDNFSYRNMNKAFKVLDTTGGDFYSLGMGKYYQEDGDLVLDVGPFTRALEFASGRSATTIGKPSSQFFRTALDDMGVAAAEAVMVGDDVVSDVGGAQQCGMQGVLVRTGKFRAADESRDDVRPDAVENNLAAIVRRLVK